MGEPQRGPHYLDHNRSTAFYRALALLPFSGPRDGVEDVSCGV